MTTVDAVARTAAADKKTPLLESKASQRVLGCYKVRRFILPKPEMCRCYKTGGDDNWCYGICYWHGYDSFGIVYEMTAKQIESNLFGLRVYNIECKIPSVFKVRIITDSERGCICDAEDYGRNKDCKAHMGPPLYYVWRTDAAEQISNRRNPCEKDGVPSFTIEELYRNPVYLDYGDIPKQPPSATTGYNIINKFYSANSYKCIVCGKITIPLNPNSEYVRLQCCSMACTIRLYRSPVIEKKIIAGLICPSCKKVGGPHNLIECKICKIFFCTQSLGDISEDSKRIAYNECICSFKCYDKTLVGAFASKNCVTTDTPSPNSKVDSVSKKDLCIKCFINEKDDEPHHPSWFCKQCKKKIQDIDKILFKDEKKQSNADIKMKEDPKEDNNNNSSNQQQCIICMDEKREVLMVPCGHVFACEECSKKVTHCSICRVEIERVIKMYMV